MNHDAKAAPAKRVVSIYGKNAPAVPALSENAPAKRRHEGRRKNRIGFDFKVEGVSVEEFNKMHLPELLETFRRAKIEGGAYVVKINPDDKGAGEEPAACPNVPAIATAAALKFCKRRSR